MLQVLASKISAAQVSSRSSKKLSTLYYSTYSSIILWFFLDTKKMILFSNSLSKNGEMLTVDSYQGWEAEIILVTTRTDIILDEMVRKMAISRQRENYCHLVHDMAGNNEQWRISFGHGK